MPAAAKWTSNNKLSNYPDFSRFSDNFSEIRWLFQEFLVLSSIAWLFQIFQVWGNPVKDHHIMTKT